MAHLDDHLTFAADAVDDLQDVENVRIAERPAVTPVVRSLAHRRDAKAVPRATRRGRPKVCMGVSSKLCVSNQSFIRSVDITIVICGAHTDTAKEVAAEITITREEGKPYFLLRGHANCTKPENALTSDQIHDWSWPNLHNLIYAQE